MSGGPVKPKFPVVASLLCLLVVAPCSAQQRHTTTKPVKPEQPVAEAAPAPPPTLAQMPASPPEVSFQGGQLTITAQNSTLGDILKAVRTQTGATVDFPGNASERVVGNFGPAPARDVLTTLLNGSHFNYLLLGSATDPSALDRVILTAKSGGSAANNVQQPSPMEQAGTNNQNAYPRPMQPVPAPGGNTVVVEGQDAQDDATDDSADATDDSQGDDQTDQGDQADQADDQATDDQQPQQQPDGQPAVKTPEQLLQELQQRQQQVLQQQQGVQQGVQPPGMPPGFPNPGIPGQPGMGTPPHN
jgi:hypothetical protein